MILAQLELNEAAEVEFGIEIHGTNEKTSDIRFVIEGPEYGVICKCREENGTITASIPKLKGILPAGQFEARLEVVLDGRYFMPLQESIEFKPLVEFDVTSAKAIPTQASVNTTAVKVRVIENPEKKEEPNMKAEEFGAKEEQDDNEEQKDPAQEAGKEESKKGTSPAAGGFSKSTGEKGEGTSEGDKPAETWDQIVKKSITNPKNAPKKEKGDFDYDNVKNATPILKTASGSEGTDTATKGLPPAVAAKTPTNNPAAQNTTKKSGQNSAAPATQRKPIDREKAKGILEKLNGVQARLAKLKGKKD